MFVRVQLLSITLTPYAARSLALAMVPAFIVGGLTPLLALLARNAEASASEVKLGTPPDFGPALLLAGLVLSEERRVGKECVVACKSEGWLHKRKNKQISKNNRK